MKISKKVLIPVFATAMGLSVIGGVSGAVAWYQYNTKVSTSWIGVTSADGGVLQIQKSGETSWNSYADFGSSSTPLHPITFGALTATSSLEGVTPKKHPQAGVTNPEQWDNAVKGTDYYELAFNLQAKKLNPTTKEYEACEAVVNIDDLHIAATGDNQDVASAIRVHLSSGTTNKLLSLDGGSINCYGPLDLDGSGSADKNNNYQWETGHGSELTYGVSDAVQVSSKAADLENNALLTVPVAGATVTVTIWLEGWQKLRSSAIWDATKDSGVNVQFGMKLSTPKTTFLTD